MRDCCSTCRDDGDIRGTEQLRDFRHRLLRLVRRIAVSHAPARQPAVAQRFGQLHLLQHHQRTVGQRVLQALALLDPCLLSTVRTARRHQQAACKQTDNVPDLFHYDGKDREDVEKKTGQKNRPLIFGKGGIRQIL